MNLESDNSETPVARRWRPGPITWLGVLMLLALAIRIVAALTRPMIEMDETSYVRMAQNLAGGHAPFDITGTDTTNFSPLFSLLIAGLAAGVRDYVVSAYAVAAVFGALLLLPVYLLGKELGGGPRVGLMAAGLVAVMPIYVDHSSRLYSESVYIFFLLMSVVFARHMLRGCRIPCSTLAGASLGFAYLANPSALFYLLIYLVLALVVAIRKGILPQMGRAALVLLLFFSVYAVPYLLFLHGEFGHWTYNGKAPGNSYAASLGLWHGTFEWEQEMLSLTGDGALKLYRVTDSADPAGNLWRDPGRSLRNLGRQARFFYQEGAAQALPLWLLPLLGLGLFSAGWSRSRTAGVGYLLVMMLPALAVFTVYNVYARLLMPFVALALVWVAQGWERLEGWSGDSLTMVGGEPLRQRWQTAARWAIGALVIVPVLVYAGTTVTSRGYQTGYRHAGESLVAVSDEATKIMSRETSTAFYAGGELIWLPYAEYADMTAYARRHGVDFLVISRRDLDERRPCLTQFNGGLPEHPEWQLRGVIDEGTDQETYIFQLDAPPICSIRN